jgi:NADH dehydrogenase
VSENHRGRHGGALAELARATLAEDFRRIDPRRSRIVLLEAGPRILPTFHQDLAAQVDRRLERMGVEIRCGGAVEHIDARGVVVGGERIDAGVVLWTAGVKPSPAASWLGAAADRAGRVKVEADLTLPGRPEVFVVGDVSAREQDGRQLPGVAQVAIQGGRHAGRTIAARVGGKRAVGPFRYFNKGDMAVVGRNFAILERERIRIGGLFAWLAWAFVHVVSLALFNNRLIVFTQWLWSYFTFERGSRLITVAPAPKAPVVPPSPRPPGAPASAAPPSDSR